MGVYNIYYCDMCNNEYESNYLIKTGSGLHICKSCIGVKLRVVLDNSALVNEDALSYLNQIEKIARQHDVSIEQVLVSSEKAFQEAVALNVPTLVLQPCMYDTSIVANAAEKNQTARVVASMISHSDIITPTVLVVNRSELIGKPLVYGLMSDRDTNPAIINVNSKTPQNRVYEYMKYTDIVVFATGKKQPLYNVSNKIVIDVSNDCTSSQKRHALRYYGRNVIGRLTTELLIQDVRRWYFDDEEYSDVVNDYFINNNIDCL